MTKEELARFCLNTYGEMLQEVGVQRKIRPSILAGIMMRESECGLSPLLKPNGPEGIGDGGKAYGLFQIDKHWHSVFIELGIWKIPKASCVYASDLLNKNMLGLRYQAASRDLPAFDLEAAMIAAYNCGIAAVIKAISLTYFNKQDVDALTTGHNYSKDVLANALIYRAVKASQQVTGVLAI